MRRELRQQRLHCRDHAPARFVVRWRWQACNDRKRLAQARHRRTIRNERGHANFERVALERARSAPFRGKTVADIEFRAPASFERQQAARDGLPIGKQRRVRIGKSAARRAAIDAPRYVELFGRCGKVRCGIAQQRHEFRAKM